MDNNIGAYRKLNSFVTSFLRRILGYHRQEHESNDRVLREAFVIRDRQLRFFAALLRARSSFSGRGPYPPKPVCTGSGFKVEETVVAAVLSGYTLGRWSLGKGPCQLLGGDTFGRL